ncbi:MAG: DUF1924 domain-containing protein [Stellaceae bacterium]
MRLWMLVGVILALAIASEAAPAGRDSVLAMLAAEAKQGSVSFSGFSAERGHVFWTSTHAGGNPDTRSCTACHTQDPRAIGQTRAGKTIQPMAVSKNPDRFTDPRKVEQWFARNCKTVLGRECTPIEKGDVITYLATQ